VPPVASILKKKNKNTDPGAPRPSSTECSFIVYRRPFYCKRKNSGHKRYYVHEQDERPTRSIKDMFSSIDQL
jgi:hypothetical protein